jgi:P-type Ca2+ transporter type 2C
MIWHQASAQNTYDAFGSSPQGLTDDVVKERQLSYGPNTLEEKKKKPAWQIFLSQFKDFMIVILLAAALISGILGDVTDTIIIVIIVFLNAIIGFVQEYRAEKALEALKKMSVVQATVIRNNKTSVIPSPELVPGDLVVIEAGNSVPADLRLVEAHQLQINESALTGESIAIHKETREFPEEDIPLGDRLNMSYKSSAVVNGRGKGIVIATGMETEIGHIAKMLQEDELDTPLKKRMASFGKMLSYVILAICILLFVVGLLRGEEPLKMLLISISLAVAAIPEALPALITIALSMGAKRLMMKKALIRKLPAVETLGSISFICSDKTGTLTVNRMKVIAHQEFVAKIDLQDFSPFLAGMALNHDVKGNKGEWIGDPTEIALIEKAYELNNDAIDKLGVQLPRVAELPFDSDRKCMTTVHEMNGRFLVLSKGAVESISSRLITPDPQFDAQANEWSSEGMRVISFAYRIIDSLPEQLDYNLLERDLVATGLVGMIDPPREEAKAAIHDCKTAGIKPVMITGDHPETARYVARQIGILNEGDISMSGKELSAMNDDEFNSKVEKIAVYARVSPEQKLRIVRGLQSRGHFIAMTGDGVNDAPSLKAADIGVAMGINGTDVSKESAEMILLDDNFATIVNAVKEGRRIYDNIRKFVKYIMTCNSAEIWTIFLAPLMGLPMPLLPIHILWINLVTDGLPGLALANEKEEPDIMKRPPRPSGESLFARGIGIHIMWVGILMAALTLTTQAWAIRMDNAHWQTMVFTVLSFIQLGHVLAIRSEKQFLFKQGIFSNLPLIGSVLLTFVLQIMVIYLPVANKIFKTQPLELNEFLICIGVATVLFHAVELEKFIKGRKAI